jgi:hypothetical protein
MSLRPGNCYARTLIAAAAALLLVASSSQAQNGNPFTKLGGSWSGGGSVVFSSGTRERIRCRAGYIAADLFNLMTLRLELRCASDSYNFDLQSDINYNGGEISGVWSELTRGISGKITGSVAGNQIQAIVESQTFQAILELTTQGDRQSVRIQSPGGEMSEVVIALARVPR